VIFTLIALLVLAVVFCSAIVGILARRILPANHLTDETRNVVILATGVVGTLTALVLGLLIAAASNSFNTKNEEVILMAADVIQIDHLLNAPFRGLIRISSKPMKDALDEISRK
jgi:hypothetical protein